MLLNYYRGQNFGDALNPIIFNQLLPGFFDDDPTIEFSGIGSIIGLPMSPEAKRRIIFSSGFAYGTLPQIDDTYDIVCVRGPLTANILKIDPNRAITDGAILLNALKLPRPDKKVHKYSFMPHWESELKYPWKEICQEADINYISPTLSPMEVIDEILKSEFIIAEAMHAAIVSDTLRVPWLAVKAYNGINEFKWNDWTQSLSMKYTSHTLRSMYSSTDFMVKVFKEKIPVPMPNGLIKLNLKLYQTFQDAFFRKETVNKLEGLKKEKFQLSEDKIFKEKFDRIYATLLETRDRYNSLR